MKFFLYIYFLLLCFSASGQYDDSKSYHVWKEGYKIDWDLFKASPDSTYISDFPAVAYISFTRVGDAGNIQIVCVLDGTKSWTIDKSTTQLDHQQLHFDLAEVYAREMRKTFKELSGEEKLTSQRVAIVMRGFEEMYNEEFLSLDDETNHGFNREKEKEWRESIDSRLKALANYK